MKTTIRVTNLMSLGCRNSIHEGIGALPGIFGVVVSPDTGEVTVDHTDEVSPAQIRERLRNMGYTPEP
ncbi:MAG: heavy-metal-associated domain-containing protein [Rikenellaceae bacterium]|nr:heavy-metal-associated domain-containing protein [Rikenellaceae bacterium]